jgi:hypothetical protein
VARFVSVCAVDTQAVRFRSRTIFVEDHAFGPFHSLRVFSIETLPKRELSNSAFFTLIILPSIVGSGSLLHPKMRAQGYWMHIDSVQSHNVALSLQKTEEVQFAKLLQLPCSLDFAPCDFVLFEY